MAWGPMIGVEMLMSEPLTGVDHYERIALAVREALPGEAGERLLEQILDELAAVDAEDAELRLELERQAATDHVTGLPNRSRFMTDLTRDIARARRADEPLALLVLDILGSEADEHAAGVELLRLVRTSDVVAHIGPGRFAIILPRTGTVGCALVAARVAGLEGQSFGYGNATLTADIVGAAELLAEAESSLGDRA